MAADAKNLIAFIVLVLFNCFTIVDTSRKDNYFIVIMNEVKNLFVFFESLPQISIFAESVITI